MKKHLIYIIPIFILLAGNSCKKTSLTAGFDESIKIEMTEIVDSVQRTLTLNCFTEKIFGCSNYKIETTVSVTNDRITINFVKIITSNFCLTALGPATKTFSLTGLANKQYDLEINIGSNKITGQMDVSQGSFIATLPAQTKAVFVNPDLKRVPDNTIYGTVHYHSTATLPTVQKFIDSLQLYGALPASYLPGDYAQFKIEANGQIKQTQDLGYNFTQYFIFNYTGNSGQIKGLVKRFGINYPNLLLITLYTTKGETFYSWTP